MITGQDDEMQFIWHRNTKFNVDRIYDENPAEVLSDGHGQSPRTTADTIRVFKLSAASGSE